MSEVETSAESDNLFYFESDHLALRGNKEYLNVLKCIAILESQRIQAIKDIDQLYLLQDEALKDPMTFVEKLQNGVDLGIPSRQVIPEIPEINWSQYNISQNLETNRPFTRNANTRTNGKLEVIKKEEESTEDRGKILVRGRLFDDSKPETFNQLWTADEQRRLEELLVEFPPEEVETRRWKKIADALGNRTAKQVCSRVQKYFIKLQKAGLSVPGRIPRTKYMEPIKKIHKHQRNNHFLFRPTTFFPSQDIPVHMTEFDDEPLNYSSSIHSDDNGSHSKYDKDDDLTDEEQLSVPDHTKSTEENQKYILLKKIKKEMEKVSGIYIEHTGFKCDICREEPILGTRWHCEDCPFPISIDFCTDCFVSQLDSQNPHPLSHRFISVNVVGLRKKPTNLWDEDYNPQSFSNSENGSNYNYLDPNFMPE